MFNAKTIEKHSTNCQLYSILINEHKNGFECRVCFKTYQNRQGIHRHVGHLHKEELLDAQKNPELYLNRRSGCRAPATIPWKMEF